MGEVVPYKAGMQHGQGYNTYLQSLCVKDAVTIDRHEDKDPAFTREYDSEFIEEYEKIAKSMKISAGAAVSGWGQSGNVNVSILNRSEFESSTLTYEVKVLVQHQVSVLDKHSFNKIETSNPHATYGDRFIADFIKGGHFYARVSITAKNSSETSELKQSAELAMTMYGVSGKVTQEVEQAVSSIKRNASVKITIIESTGTNKNSTSGGSFAVQAEESSDLLAVKAKADQFYKDADTGKHSYILFAVLGKYRNLSNFGSYFVPFDYQIASLRSWALFNDFTLYKAIETMIKAVPAGKFKDGSERKTQLSNQAINIFENIRNRVHRIAEHPEVAKETPDHEKPDNFRLEVLKAIKTVDFHAQSKIIPNTDDYWTDMILPSKGSSEEHLFTFPAFDFGDLIGTEVISFGKKNSAEDYICLIGERATSVDGYKELSHFWIFPDSVEKFAMDMYAVSKVSTRNLMRVYAADQRDIENPRPHQRFWFFVPNA
ncbi:hypothetical protein G6011_04393 [Alternaria panax]|uniref:Uncharacterized protein n=1 Tax=Alternaria panax TaxID=48097 RepID=A0AAD4IGG1_9PLEO|nr:hypothetical protein G6011_04393 [Alternaria panax]